MLSYLQKFNNLPKNIKDAISVTQIIELGKKYKIDLAATVMKVMAKEVKLDGLSAFLINQLNLSGETAKNLERDLRKYIFSPVIDYLVGVESRPKLVFAESDEKEVKANAQPVVTIDFDQTIEDGVARIVDKTRLTFSDPLVGGKFRQVIKTYLRQTRDRKATIEALTKAAELGGVSLSRDAAERALSFADLELAQLKRIETPAPQKIAVPEDLSFAKASESKPENPFKKKTDLSAGALAQADYNLETVLREQGKIIEPAKPIMDPAHELPSPPPAIVAPVPAPAPVRTLIKEVISKPPLDKPKLRKLAATPAPTKGIINLPSASSGKIKMDDIRFTPQILSPIDELRYMTIKNFRRLNVDPLKAIEKIKEKLELLGRDDYSRKIEGIVAWHESPLNNLYLQLCRKALDDGKPLGDILREETKREPASLKPNELEAIITLNKSLKF